MSKVEAVFAAAGFSIVTHETVTQVVAATWPEFVSKIALRGYSTVASLGDKDSRPGWRRWIIFATRRPGPRGDRRIDWLVFRAP